MLTKTPSLLVRATKLYPVQEAPPLRIAFRRKIDPNLNSLRGFLVLIVIFRHVLDLEYIDPNFSPPYLHSLRPTGVLRVLVFFVISGYVIGLANKKSLTGNNCITYLKKRFIRIYPIYAISLLLALAISTSTYSVQTIAGNFFFMQVAFSDVILENGPIWSLQYEIVYFLLFIPISFFSFNPIRLAIVAIILGLVNFALYPLLNMPVLSSYLFGLTFWAAGLAVARYCTISRREVNYSLLLSFVPLIFCLNKINIISIGLSALADTLVHQEIDFPESVSWFERAVTFSDLGFLPYCVMFVLAFCGKEFKYKRQIFTFLMLLPSLGLAYMLSNIETYSMMKFTILLLFYVSSLVLYYYRSNYLNKIAHYFMKKAAWLGDISYSLFIIHLPLLFLFNRVDFFSGSITTYILRFAIYGLLLVSICYLLEKKLQPLIKRKFA